MVSPGVLRPETGPRSRTGRATAAGLALAALGLLAGGCGDDGDATSSQARAVADAAGLAPEVADFFALAGREAGATYRVTYASTDVGGAPLQITVAKQPPNQRLDLFGADGTIDSTIRTREATFQCTRTASIWQCGELGPNVDVGTAFDPEVVAATIEQLSNRRDQYEFAVATRTIAGVDATCLTTTPRDTQTPDGTLCLADDGAQLLVDTARGRVEATEYGTDVAADTFEPPAAPDPTEAPP